MPEASEIGGFSHATRAKTLNPEALLEQSIELLLDLIEDGKQRLEDASSTAEWVRLAGAIGQAEARLGGLLSLKLRLGGGKPDFEQHLLQAIREWQASRSPSLASGKTAAQLAAQHHEPSAHREAGQA